MGRRRGVSRWAFAAFVALVATCGAAQGVRDARASAVQPLSLSTTVYDASTNQPWNNAEVAGASVYDTAQLSWTGAIPTGTVTYVLYEDPTCQTKNVTGPDAIQVDGNGNVANSFTVTGVAPAGQYGYQATYNGTDYGTVAGQCEPFTVNAIFTSLSVQVYDPQLPSGPSVTWTNTETSGAQASATAAFLVPTNANPVVTGTVTYTIWTGACPPSGVLLDRIGNLSLDASGDPPSSGVFTDRLGASSYCFEADYSGDSYYAASSATATFEVLKGTTTTTTGVHDSSGNPWGVDPGDVAGAEAKDEAFVAAFSTTSVTPSGSVTYTFYSGADCSAGDASTSTSDTETLVGGSGGSVSVFSAPSSPLAVGSYSYQATYNGDGNFLGSTGACENFTVPQASPTVSTTVIDDATGKKWAGTEDIGAQAYDTVTVGGVNALTPTGTVTFTLYSADPSTGTCLTAQTASDTESLTAGGARSLPTAALSAGTYGFQAAYNGDSNFAAQTGPCEVFTVGAAAGTVGTVVYVSGGNAWDTTDGEPLGTGAFDTATIASTSGFPPAGTVTYAFFENGACAGMATQTSSPPGTVSNGSVPDSFTVASLGAGSYSFQATHSGDPNYGDATSPCEPFTVNKATTTTSVSLDKGTAVAGAQASELATVSGAVGTFTPTGTVVYSIYGGSTCGGTAAFTSTVMLSGGSAPGSGSTGALAAGSYSYAATYSGDSNYVGSATGCLTFTIADAATTTASAVDDATTMAPWSGKEVTGATAYDTATVSTASSFVPTGTVTYTLYDLATAPNCVGTAMQQGTATLTSGGAVPNSGSTAALAPGNYGYIANYSGDSNFLSSNGGCETFSVAMAGQPVNSVVDDAATNAAWAGTEQPGASAYDTATITPIGGFTPTGTVTYSFFKNGNCTAPATTTGTVTVTAGGTVPNSAPTAALLPGTYSFQAAYGGDANYAAASSCSQFSVQNNPIVITPSSATVAPLGKQVFTVSGGTGTGYTWSFATNGNASGGNVVAGAYQAGGIGGVTDVIQVADSLGETKTANVTVTAALALAPTMASTPPRGTISFQASGGAQPYTWKLQTNGSGATLGASGAYIAGTTGNTSDTVVVSDDNGALAQAIVTVTAGVSISPTNGSTPPSGMIAFTAMGGSGTGYVWTLSANRSGGSINSSTGAYVAGTKGMVSDVVTVTDSLGNTASASVSVGGGVSISPFAPSIPPRGTQTFTATGGSGSGYTWTLAASPSGGTVNASTGAYTAGTTGSRTDVLQVADSLGNTATTNINVTAGVGISPATSTVAPVGTVKFSASGGSGSGYTYSLTTNASGGSINASTGAYKAGPAGNVTDVVQVADSLGNSASASVSVTAAIAISPTSASVAPRGGTTFSASGGSGTYVFSLQTNASAGSITPQGKYTAGAKPSVADVVEVVDTNGATATATVTVGAGISISPVTPSVAPGGQVQFTAMGGSGTGFIWTLTTNQSGGGITVGGAYTAGSTGKTADAVKVVDSLGNSATTAVSVGAGLAISPTVASTAPQGKVSFSAVGGSGGYHYAITTNASGSSIDASTGAYTAGDKGNVIDSVTVTDSSGATSSANIAVGPGVSVTPATVTVMSGDTVPFAVAGGSGAGYTWTILPNQSGGTIDATTGVYTAGSVGGVTDRVVATDSLGNTGTALVTVKPHPMMGGDGGVDSGTPMDGGVPQDSGSKTDSGPMGMDGSIAMDGSMAGMDGSSGGNDSGFEVDGSNFDAGGPNADNGGGSCGCTVVGVDTSGFGPLGGLVLGLGLALRRRRRH